MDPDQAGSWLAANWPAPPRVRAGITARSGGFSQAPFDSFNLGMHVGDSDDAARRNRQTLVSRLGLCMEPTWLKQSHGARVIDLDSGGAELAADACSTQRPGQACVVLTADCIPLLITDRTGTEVAAVHIGWRGLAANIARNTVHCLHHPPDELLAWIGPHISAGNYTVGNDVRDACLRAAPAAADGFTAAGPALWRADLGLVLRCQLHDCGLEAIHADGRCTFRDRELFYSYRRDGRTGRMASLIWIEEG